MISDSQQDQILSHFLHWYFAWLFRCLWACFKKEIDLIIGYNLSTDHLGFNVWVPLSGLDGWYIFPHCPPVLLGCMSPSTFSQHIDWVLYVTQKQKTTTPTIYKFHVQWLNFEWCQKLSCFSTKLWVWFPVAGDELLWARVPEASTRNSLWKPFTWANTVYHPR